MKERERKSKLGQREIGTAYRIIILLSLIITQMVNINGIHEIIRKNYDLEYYYTKVSNLYMYRYFVSKKSAKHTI